MTFPGPQRLKRREKVQELQRIAKRGTVGLPWKALGDYRSPVGIFVESPFCTKSEGKGLGVGQVCVRTQSQGHGGIRRKIRRKDSQLCIHLPLWVRSLTPPFLPSAGSQ